MSFKVSSSSISFLFWTSSTAFIQTLDIFFLSTSTFFSSFPEKKIESKRGKTRHFRMHATDKERLKEAWEVWSWWRSPSWDKRSHSMSNTKPNWVLKGHWGPFHKSFHKAISSMAAPPALIRVQSKQGPSQRQLLCFMAIKIFEGALSSSM